MLLVAKPQSHNAKKEIDDESNASQDGALHGVVAGAAR
jgi:hypothetical protein